MKYIVILDPDTPTEKWTWQRRKTFGEKSIKKSIKSHTRQ